MTQLSDILQIPRTQAAGQPAPPSAATTAAARAARKRKLKEAPASPEPENGKAELRMVGRLGCTTQHAKQVSHTTCAFWQAPQQAGSLLHRPRSFGN